MRLRRVAKWLFGCVFVLLSASFAHADFRVCNATQGAVGVAIGYRAPSGWVSEGWWHINVASCKTVIEGPLSSRFYYLYGEAIGGKSRWDGPVAMCGREKAFKIDGVQDCFARGFQKFGFQEIDTRNQISWMVQLTEPTQTTTPLTNPLVTGAGAQ